MKLKIWIFNLVITLVQLFAVLSAVYIRNYQVYRALSIATQIVLVIGILLVVAFIIVKNKDIKYIFRVGYLLSFSYSFADLIIVNGCRHLIYNDKVYLAGALVGFVIFILYLYASLQIIKIIEPKSNKYLVALICLPFGIGILSGTIILIVKITKKIINKIKYSR